MCTLTYIPNGENGYYLTTNRDESPLRPTEAPLERVSDGIKLIFPMDKVAGGTWIAASNTGRSACLLNGAFTRHEPGIFRKSRGLVLLASFQFKDPDSFQKEYELEGIEPFTIIFVDQVGTGLRIKDFRWDGKQSHLAIVDAGKPQIWSSAQLYRPEVISNREKWFRDWLELHHEHSVESIHEFHNFGGTGDVYNDLRMNRGFVRTVSTTSISTGDGVLEMRYHDLVTGHQSQSVLQSAIP